MTYLRELMSDPIGGIEINADDKIVYWDNKIKIIIIITNTTGKTLYLLLNEDAMGWSS